VKVVIDSSSLVSLSRYYLPFDKNQKLYGFIKSKIESGEIVIIDRVFRECSFTSKGIVLQSLDFLDDKSFLKSNKVPKKTDDLIAPAPQKFLRQLDNQFVNRVILRQRKLTNVEYENQKESFLDDADMKQIILCLNYIQEGEETILVTEETEISNDNKLFKKIPAICKELNIETLTLPELISRYQGIDLDFN